MTQIPAVGAQLSAVMGNLAMGIAGAAASALAIMMYELVMEGVMGLMGGGASSSDNRSNSQIASDLNWAPPLGRGGAFFV